MDMDCDFDMQLALDSVESFVDGLMDFNVVIMENNQPDIQVITCKYDVELFQLIDEHLGPTYTQTIVNNMNPETKIGCPYFRVCMLNFGNNSTINFKLQTFFKNIGMDSLNPRCKRALVVGLASLQTLNSPISVPTAFCSTRISPIDLAMEPELDMSCLKICNQQYYPEGTTLCDIAGMDLPCFLPCEVQFLILQFCSSPTCDLIRDEMCRLCHQWDLLLFPMFQQREPRIPAPIASFYDAPTVQSTVAAVPELTPVRPAQIRE